MVGQVTNQASEAIIERDISQSNRGVLFKSYIIMQKLCSPH